MNSYRKTALTAAVLCSLTASAGCQDFLDVANPTTLEAEAVDPDRDRTLLSQSVWQAFVSRIGNMEVYVAWFSNEARVGDTFPTRNDFGRRDIPENNGDNNDRWNNQHATIQFAEEVIRRIEGAGNTLDLARAYLASGYSMIAVGELYCEATLAESWTVARGPMTSAQILDSSIVRLQKANDIARTLTGADASAIANAALVGIARAHLQNGRKPQASTIAGQVPATFVMNVLHMDDPAQRGGLGNTIWSFSEARISLVVPP
jgi:hypothetical protein